MKKSVKCIVASSVFIIGSGTNVNKAKGIRNRLISIFRIISFRNGLNSNIKLNISSSLVNKANDLFSKNIEIGLGIDEFDPKAIEVIKSKNWYLQRKNHLGDLLTLVSKTKPKITDIDGKGNVKVEYRDINNKKVTAYHIGLPRWLSGVDIKNKLKKIKYINLNEHKLSLDVSISSEKRTNIIGLGIEGFDTSGIDIKADKWYHQHNFGDGGPITIKLNDEPSVLYANRNFISKNADGNLESSFKYTRWVKGIDLKKIESRRKFD